jgi:hypothetical protein
MRNKARIRVVLAVALPDPLIVLKVMQKSLIIFDFIGSTNAASKVKNYSKDKRGAIRSR